MSDEVMRAMERRLARRGKGKFIGMVFPFPICDCREPDSEGVFFRVMIPCDGVLSKALVSIDDPLKDNPVEVQARLKVENDVYARDTTITSPLSEFNLNLDVSKGSKLTLAVTSGNVEKPIWVSLLFVPSIPNATIKKVAEEDQDAKETRAQASA